jgi:acid stress-induced BolA-like protein IbaG/YrbA
MLPEKVKQLLLQKFNDATINITGEGCDFSIKIISNIFVGLRAVKRQQLVYNCLDNLIKTGELHAVTMNLLTIDEANNT